MHPATLLHVPISGASGGQLSAREITEPRLHDPSRWPDQGVSTCVEWTRIGSGVMSRFHYKGIVPPRNGGGRPFP